MCSARFKGSKSAIRNGNILNRKDGTFQSYSVATKIRHRSLGVPCNLSDDVPKRVESIILSIVEGVIIEGFISPSWSASFK
jgi:hypothetical protein